MAFVQAMGTPDLTKEGVNGADVYTEEGVGDYRVSLYTMLNRGLEEEYIQESVERIFERGVHNEMMDLFVMAFHVRDVRGGKGERKLFYHFMKSLYRVDKEVCEAMLELIPEYGCWRDMWEIIRLIPELEEAVCKIVKQIFLEDLIMFSTSEESNMSLLAKWLPREGSGTFKGLARKLANYIYSSEKSERKRLVRYRKDTSMMNKVLKTVEINMCGHTWRDIKPEAVPGRCMKNHRKAFLNQPLNNVTHMGEELRYPTSEDRMECRKHFLEFIEGLKNGTKTVKGVNVAMPHDEMRVVLDDERYDAVRHIWNRVRYID